ncbi:MAG TPA: hypothetical protein VM243_02310 [Phycisphaerae bacterium]|nr:hypothetical protein [Phycisphaerae bacterium]
MSDARAGSVEPIMAKLTDSAGDPATGLSPTLTIRAIGGTNDGKYLQADLSWGAAKDDIPMVEVDSTNSAGKYQHNFALPVVEVSGGEVVKVIYDVDVDGTASASPRYHGGEIRSAPADWRDVDLAVAGEVAWRKLVVGDHPGRLELLDRRDPANVLYQSDPVDPTDDTKREFNPV